MPGEVAMIRVINQSSYSCFLTFLQIVVEKLMKVKSVMVSSLASGKYDTVPISEGTGLLFFLSFLPIGEVVCCAFSTGNGKARLTVQCRYAGTFWECSSGLPLIDSTR